MGAVARNQSGGSGDGGDDKEDSHLNSNSGGNGIGMIGRSSSAEEYRPERNGLTPHVNSNDEPQQTSPLSISRSLSSGSGSFKPRKNAENFRSMPIPSATAVPHRFPAGTSPPSRRIGTASAMHPRSRERREEPGDDKLPGQPISAGVDEGTMSEGGKEMGARSNGKDDGWTGGEILAPEGQKGGNIEGDGKVRMESIEPSSSVLSTGSVGLRSSREASPVRRGEGSSPGRRRGEGSTPGSRRGERPSPVRKEGAQSSREASPDRSGRSNGYTPSAATSSARGRANVSSGGLYPRGDFFGDER